MRMMMTAAFLTTLTLFHPGVAKADDMTKADLKPFNVTIRVFDPSRAVPDHVATAKLSS